MESRTDERVRSRSVVRSWRSIGHECLLDEVAVIVKANRMLVLAAVRAVLPHQLEGVAFASVEPAIVVGRIAPASAAQIRILTILVSHSLRRITCHLRATLLQRERVCSF